MTNPKKLKPVGYLIGSKYDRGGGYCIEDAGNNKVFEYSSKKNAEVCLEKTENEVVFAIIPLKTRRGK